MTWLQLWVFCKQLSLKVYPPDVILLKFDMPGMSGPEVSAGCMKWSNESLFRPS